MEVSAYPRISPVLAVYCNAGEISHMLPGAGQLIEQGSLAAVLIAYQCEGQLCPFRQRVAAAFGMKPSFLSKTGMQRLLRGLLFRTYLCSDRLYLNLRGIGQSESKLIAVDPKLNGITHGSKFYDCDLRTWDYAHVKKMLAQGALSAYAFYKGGLSDFKFLECHTLLCITHVLPPVYVHVIILSPCMEKYKYEGSKYKVAI